MGFDPIEPKLTRKHLAKEVKRMERGEQVFPHHQGGSPPHGFGYPAHRRSGHLRLSGKPGAHRIGRR